MERNEEIEIIINFLKQKLILSKDFPNFTDYIIKYGKLIEKYKEEYENNKNK